MRKKFTGTVISNKMNKTVLVEVERRFPHHKYRKVITKHKKFKAHNEAFDLKVGDRVVIEETRPISKDKHFQVIKKISH